MWKNLPNTKIKRRRWRLMLIQWVRCLKKCPKKNQYHLRNQKRKSRSSLKMMFWRRMKRQKPPNRRRKHKLTGGGRRRKKLRDKLKNKGCRKRKPNVSLPNRSKNKEGKKKQQKQRQKQRGDVQLRDVQLRDVQLRAKLLVRYRSSSLIKRETAQQPQRITVKREAAQQPQKKITLRMMYVTMFHLNLQETQNLINRP